MVQNPWKGWGPKKRLKDLYNFVVRGIGDEPPIDLIFERLCRKYGWTLEYVRSLSIEDINMLLDIALVDSEAGKRQEQQKDNLRSKG